MANIQLVNESINVAQRPILLSWFQSSLVSTDKFRQLSIVQFHYIRNMIKWWKLLCVYTDHSIAVDIHVAMTKAVWSENRDQSTAKRF